MPEQTSWQRTLQRRWQQDVYPLSQKKHTRVFCFHDGKSVPVCKSRNKQRLLRLSQPLKAVVRAMASSSPSLCRACQSMGRKEKETILRFSFFSPIIANVSSGESDVPSLGAGGNFSHNLMPLFWHPQQTYVA